MLADSYMNVMISLTLQYSDLKESGSLYDGKMIGQIEQCFSDAHVL